ncbi:LOW QUALITY PROTEIN: AMB domain protein [Colletotrichum tofieldiae]|nr:LOW QUALITY PROTEIN: AMB domain protein [Colletotrichum tofieldiae]
MSSGPHLTRSPKTALSPDTKAPLTEQEKQALEKLRRKHGRGGLRHCDPVFVSPEASPCGAEKPSTSHSHRIEVRFGASPSAQDGQSSHGIHNPHPQKPRHLSLGAPAAWSDVTGTLKSVAGVNAVYTGTQLEDPSKTVLIVEWASPAAFSDFAASESYTPWFASLKAVSAHSSPDSPGVAPPLFYKVPFTADSDPPAVLGAPCTEVFVAYGVDDSFVGRTAEFAKGLTEGRVSVEGFHGHAYGEISTLLAVEGSGDGEKGPAVTLLLGWDSKQAHLDAKAKAGLYPSLWSAITARLADV